MSTSTPIRAPTTRTATTSGRRVRTESTGTLTISATGEEVFAIGVHVAGDSPGDCAGRPPGRSSLAGLGHPVKRQAAPAAGGVLAGEPRGAQDGAAERRGPGGP